MEKRCIKCGRPLNRDDIGAYRRFVNRGATEFLCVECLAEHFKCPAKLIYSKIEYFKNSGCTLFN